MSNKRNKDAFTAPKKINAVPGVILFAVICVLVFAFLIIVLYQNDMINLPSFIENLLGGSDTEESSEPNDFNSSFMASIDTNEPERKSGEIFSINRDELSKIIAETEIPESYRHELTVTYYYGETENSYTAEVYKYKNKYKIECTMADGTVKSVISDGNKIRIQNTKNNQATRKTLSVSEDSGFSLYSETGIPDLSDLFAMLDQADESLSIISDYTIELLRKTDGNIVRITFKYTDTGISEVYDIYLEDGIITTAESYIGDTLYYKMTKISFTENYPTDESMFEINDVNDTNDDTESNT